MNIKIVFLALCAFQMTSGAGIADFIAPFISQINTMAGNIQNGTLQGLETLFSQTVGRANSSIDTIRNQMESALQDRISQFGKSASEVSECVQKAQGSFSKIFNASRDQLQEEADKERTSFQPLISEVNGTLAKARNLTANFTGEMQKCLSQGIAAFTCIFPIISSDGSQTQSIIQEFVKEDQELHSIFPQAVANIGSVIGKIVQSATTQSNGAIQEAVQCVQDKFKQQ